VQGDLDRWERLLKKARWELEELEQDYEAMLRGWGGDPRPIPKPPSYGTQEWDYWKRACTRIANLENYIAWQKKRVAALERAVERERRAALRAALMQEWQGSPSYKSGHASSR